MEINVNYVSLNVDNNKLLQDICVEFVGGKIYGLIGRNGSGKTMLMKCICGFVHVTEGTIYVNGKIIGKEIDFPENIGIIIETPGFIGNYTGMQNLKRLADINRSIGKKEIEETLKQVGLYDARNKKVKKYSLGMRQRLGIAQAIMENPDILILDEPFNGLDREGILYIRQLLSTLKEKGKLILLSSHSEEDIHLLCDEVYRMEEGVLTKN